MVLWWFHHLLHLHQNRSIRTTYLWSSLVMHGFIIPNRSVQEQLDLLWVLDISAPFTGVHRYTLIILVEKLSLWKLIILVLYLVLACPDCPALPLFDLISIHYAHSDHLPPASFTPATRCPRLCPAAHLSHTVSFSSDTPTHLLLPTVYSTTASLVWHMLKFTDRLF